MKRVIVSGATGLIGSSLVQELLQKGYYVLALARQGSEKLIRLPEHKNLEIIELDIKDIKLLPEKTDKKFDTFFHLAWEGLRAASRDARELQNQNYLATMGALEAAYAFDCKTFIGAGSQAEYGSFEGPVDEISCTQPVTEYGKYKLRAAQEANLKAQEYGMRFIWTRVFSVYGEYDFGDSLIMTCVRKMLNNENVPLSQCIQEWDFLYAKDAAQAFMFLDETAAAKGIYNVASGICKTLKEFVLEMKQITGSKSELMFGQIPYGPKGFVSFHPVVDKLKRDTKWQHATDFNMGIENIIKFIKDSKK